MPFFDDVDNSTLIERNIRRLTGLELEQARRMQKIFVVARNRLKMRLSTTPRDTFTEAKLKSVLAQLEGSLTELQKITKQELLIGAQIASEQAQEDLWKEINFFRKEFEGIVTPLPFNLFEKTLERQNLLMNRYASSMETYSQSLRDKIQRELSLAVLMGATSLQAVNRIDDVMRSEEWRVARIVRTELHNFYNHSKLETMEQVKDSSIPDLKKALIHPMDARTGDDSKKLAEINPVVEIGKPFKYTWKGEVRVFLSPPDRPNDRAILVPYTKEWDVT